MQRRKAERAGLVALEREMGGSDPVEPEFWEADDLDPIDDEHEERTATTTSPMAISPPRARLGVRPPDPGPRTPEQHHGTLKEEDEDDRWRREAAEAEAIEAEERDRSAIVATPDEEQWNDMEWEDPDSMELD